VGSTPAAPKGADLTVLRNALLAAAGNRSLQRFVLRHGRRFGAQRFVAGESADDLLAAIRATNERGFRVAAGLLGEDVHTADQAAAIARDYAQLLVRFASEHANANVALKLTHLGLPIGPDVAFANVKSVAETGQSAGNFVRIDMEQSAYTDATLEIYRRLRDAGYANTGTVLQAYLRRSQDDLARLLPLGPNLRLVKGAYLEPPSIAFPDKRDVDRNLMELIRVALRGGGFTAIATHDDAIIEETIAFVEREGIASGTFEFQMLYGVRPKLQAAVLGRGYPVRIAIPFGAQWYPYLMRRLAERPANLMFFVTSLFRG
jgi:proline dehydrogenase